MMAQKREEESQTQEEQLREVSRRRLSPEERNLIIQELKEDLWREVYLQLGKSALRAIVYIVGAAITYAAFWLSAQGVNIDFRIPNK